MTAMIPLSVPNLAGNELAYVKDCLDTGWISSVGSYVTRFEKSVAAFSGAGYGVAVVNGTAALHVALLLAGVGPGCVVLAPNLTFVASLNAIRYTGAHPVIFDVRADSWQMDLNLLEEWLADLEKTRTAEGDLVWQGQRVAAIMPVHVLGNIGDMDHLMRLAKTYRLTVVEDSTEALGSTYKGRHAGTFGLMGTFSFNGNKIVSTGGGGVIVTNDEALGMRAKHLTTTAKTHPFEYHHDEVGYNYRLVNVLAAIGVAQMEQLPGFLERKFHIDKGYREGLAGVGDLTFQYVSSDVKHNCWLQTIATDDQPNLIQALRQNGIDCRPFWVPMNRLPMYKNNHYVNQTDVSLSLYQRCLSVPSSTSLTDSQLERVLGVVRSHFHS